MGKVRQIYEPDSNSLFRNQLVTAGDLEDLKTALIAAFRQIMCDFKGLTVKKWLKSYEVKKLLAISTGTLQTLRNNGTIPFTKIGGIIYYDSEAIEKLLLDRQRSLHLREPGPHRY